jgi:hypothetical protein
LLARRERAWRARATHDSAALGELDTSSFNDDAREAIEWTITQLTESTRAWLGALKRARNLTASRSSTAARVIPTWEYVYAVSIARANINRFLDHALPRGPYSSPLVYRQNAANKMEATLPRAGGSAGARRAAFPDQPGQRRPATRRRSARIGHVARH